MSTLDAPEREVCTVRRPRTNTPLQALVLMNDPTYIEASRKFADRLLAAEPIEDQRFALAFRTATGRTASDRELAALRRVFDEQLARYRQQTGAALDLMKVGEAPYDTRFALPQLAAWTMVASVLLNLDETITKG